MTKREVAWLLHTKDLELHENHDLTVRQKWIAMLDFLVEDLGMLPPVCRVKFEVDTALGGFKHSPSKHQWDEEEGGTNGESEKA